MAFPFLRRSGTLPRLCGLLVILATGALFALVGCFALPVLWSAQGSLIFSWAWRPPADFGILPMLAGSLILSFSALLLAWPLSLGLACALQDPRPAFWQKWLTGLIRFMTAIPTGGLRLCRRVPAHASGQGGRRTGLRPVLALRRLCPGPAHQPHHGAGHGRGPARTDAPPAPARSFPGHEQGYRPCLPCPARRSPLAADRRPAGLRPGHRGHPHPAHAQRQCAQRPAKSVRRAADPDRPHGAGHGHGRGRPGLQFPLRGRGAFALHQYRRQPGVAASGKKAGRAPAARARPLAPPCSRGPAPAGARCRSFVQRLCPRTAGLFALAGAAGA